MTDEQQAKIKSLSFEQQKFAYEALRKEVEFRRDKAWKIFSWASTILLGTIGGLVTIAGKRESALPWWPHRTLLISAIVILTLYSFLWVKKNSQVRDGPAPKAKAQAGSISAKKASKK